MAFFGRQLSLPTLAGALGIAACAGVATIAHENEKARFTKLDFINEKVVPFDEPEQASELKGKIVIAHGTATPVDGVMDTAVGLKLPALKIYRQSEIFQWYDHGGKFREYRAEWRDAPVDSGYYDSEHQNRGVIAFPDSEIRAANVELRHGNARLATIHESLVQFLGGAKKVMISPEQFAAMPQHIRDRFVVKNGSLVEKTAAAGTPQIGDNRTRFFSVAPYEVTVVGLLGDGGKISVYPTGDSQLGAVRPGNLTMPEVYASVQKEIKYDALPYYIFALFGGIVGLGVVGADFWSAPRVIPQVKFGR